MMVTVLFVSVSGGQASLEGRGQSVKCRYLSTMGAPITNHLLPVSCQNRYALLNFRDYNRYLLVLVRVLGHWCCDLHDAGETQCLEQAESIVLFGGYARHPDRHGASDHTVMAGVANLGIGPG